MIADYSVKLGKRNRRYCSCKCICGNKIEVRLDTLRKGGRINCGCLVSDSDKLIGNKYNMLTVIGDYIKNDGGKKMHMCKCACDCGNKLDVYCYDLTHDKKKSCGCLRTKPRFASIKGSIFGNLTVIDDYSYDGIHYCKCKCNCGKYIVVSQPQLHEGKDNCGCTTKLKLRTSRTKSLVGKRFGRLIVLSDFFNKGYHMCNCKCDCGNTVSVNSQNLKTGFTQSCGCLFRERISVHGMSGTRFYCIWQDMKDRCYNKNNTYYHNYGGRGICCEWASFKNFKDDMYESYIQHVE